MGIGALGEMSCRTHSSLYVLMFVVLQGKAFISICPCPERDDRSHVLFPLFSCAARSSGGTTRSLDFDYATAPPAHTVPLPGGSDTDHISFDGYEASISKSERARSWTINPHIGRGPGLASPPSRDHEQSSTTDLGLHGSSDLPSSPTSIVTKDAQIALLVAHYKTHGDWPSIGYKDPKTSLSLGVFLDRVIERQVVLTQSQRELLLAADPDVFGVKFSIKRAAMKARHIALSKDDKVARLADYYYNHGSWPAMSFKDPETGVALGAFLRKVIDGEVSLTAAQRIKLHAADPELFDAVAPDSVGSGHSASEPIDMEAMDLLLKYVMQRLV